MWITSKKPIICPICQQEDCINEMCSAHVPLDFDDDSRFMLGDPEIPQLGSPEAGRFFKDIDEL